jgi:hypothetical protein
LESISYAGVFGSHQLPSSGHLLIHADGQAAGNCQVQVFDLLGRLMFETKKVLICGENVLSMPYLKTGFYILIYKTGNGTYAERIIMK